MSADRTEFDDGPPGDPFEADLVAYLDGELGGEAARRVEARLAADPAARARAAELRRAYDLLDFLPKPEPSPNFTTRTLDKLPAVQSGPRPAAAAPAVSTSVPVPLDAPPPARRRPLARAAALVAAVAVCGALGYFATGAVRPLLAPAPPAREPDDAKGEPDPRVIDLLPVYAAADDIQFVQELAKRELFGDDPAVSYDPGLKLPAGADTADRPTGKERDALLKAFRALPPTRQVEIARLDADLHAKEPRERDRLFRALEAYSAWLDRLPDADRRGALAAATPSLRLAVVRDLREQQWLDALPPPVRKRADALPGPREKAELIQQWKDEEAVRRDRWAFLREHADAFAANRSPWPFDTDAGRKEVIEFARAAFKPDEPRRCRLTADELADLRRALALAERDGAWAWYGLTVYELSRQHPYLPEPAEPKLLLTEPAELPEAVYRAVLKKGGATRLKQNTFGKWPDFPLGVAAELQQVKFVPASLPPLGPARASEFKEPVRRFAEKELLPKLSADDKLALEKLEGKWPEYPREFVRLAARHDLSVPGVTLPGAPKRWDATYGRRGRPN